MVKDYIKKLNQIYVMFYKHHFPYRVKHMAGFVRTLVL